MRLNPAATPGPAHMALPHLALRAPRSCLTQPPAHMPPTASPPAASYPARPHALPARTPPSSVVPYLRAPRPRALPARPAGRCAACVSGSGRPPWVGFEVDRDFGGQWCWLLGLWQGRFFPGESSQG
jgi:hypothetical protein